MMKAVFAICSLCLLASNCLARPIKIPPYEELFATSDLVAILSIERIEISEELSAENPNPKKYQDYVAHCKIEHVIKGNVGTKSIAVPFFQDPSGAPGFNGAMPAPFTQKKWIHYLAFLKKGNGGNWLPTAGTHDAALSIKPMKLLLDPADLELPEKGIEEKAGK